MFIALCLCAYLLGSVSFAVLLSRQHGIADPRSHGSGNPGTSNMLRTAGKRLALLTLLGDVGKGLLPVLLAWGFQVNTILLGTGVDNVVLVQEDGFTFSFHRQAVKMPFFSFGGTFGGGRWLDSLFNYTAHFIDSQTQSFFIKRL